MKHASSPARDPRCLAPPWPYTLPPARAAPDGAVRTRWQLSEAACRQVSLRLAGGPAEARRARARTGSSSGRTARCSCRSARRRWTWRSTTSRTTTASSTCATASSSRRGAGASGACGAHGGAPAPAPPPGHPGAGRAVVSAVIWVGCRAPCSDVLQRRRVEVAAGSRLRARCRDTRGTVSCLCRTAQPGEAGSSDPANTLLSADLVSGR